MEKKKPRILIIEDDEYSRGAIEHLLNAKGCEIISTAGGRRGFGLARSWRLSR
jgi:CheY-like chemotaxis protein